MARTLDMNAFDNVSPNIVLSIVPLSIMIRLGPNDDDVVEDDELLPV